MSIESMAFFQMTEGQQEMAVAVNGLPAEVTREDLWEHLQEARRRANELEIADDALTDAEDEAKGLREELECAEDEVAEQEKRADKLESAAQEAADYLSDGLEHDRVPDLREVMKEAVKILEKAL